jgi:hypothetical protein
MAWEAVSKTDLEKLEQQLRRSPRQLAGIAKRCRFGYPTVVVNQPLPGREGDAYFFPTLFWLTCPALNKMISRLEDEGWIQRLQEQVGQNIGLERALNAAHAAYGAERKAMIGADEYRRLEQAQPQLARDLEQRGIGGVAEWHTIKCLHMHYAHYLATQQNPIGQWLEEQFSLEGAASQCTPC